MPSARPTTIPNSGRWCCASDGLAGSTAMPVSPATSPTRAFVVPAGRRGGRRDAARCSPSRSRPRRWPAAGLPDWFCRGCRPGGGHPGGAQGRRVQDWKRNAGGGHQAARARPPTSSRAAADPAAVGLGRPADSSTLAGGRRQTRPVRQAPGRRWHALRRGVYARPSAARRQQAFTAWAARNRGAIGFPPQCRGVTRCGELVDKKTGVPWIPGHVIREPGRPESTGAASTRDRNIVPAPNEPR